MVRKNHHGRADCGKRQVYDGDGYGGAEHPDGLVEPETATERRDTSPD